MDKLKTHPTVLWLLDVSDTYRPMCLTQNGKVVAVYTPFRTRYYGISLTATSLSLMNSGSKPSFMVQWGSDEMPWKSSELVTGNVREKAPNSFRYILQVWLPVQFGKEHFDTFAERMDAVNVQVAVLSGAAGEPIVVHPTIFNDLPLDWEVGIYEGADGLYLKYTGDFLPGHCVGNIEKARLATSLGLSSKADRFEISVTLRVSDVDIVKRWLVSNGLLWSGNASIESKKPVLAEFVKNTKPGEPPVIYYTEDFRQVAVFHDRREHTFDIPEVDKLYLTRIERKRGRTNHMNPKGRTFYFYYGAREFEPALPVAVV